MSARTLEIALKYANYGWFVLPLRPRRKDPLTEHGLHDASRDSTVLTDWWNDTAEANVGVRTGEVSGIVVIDLDGPEGEASWATLIDQHGVIETLAQQTGRADGGRQLFFRHPGVKITNRSRVLPGIDVRGDGGYVVAPPSVHPTGAVYKWLGRHPIEVMPQWLVELCVRAPEKPRTPDAPKHRATPGNASPYGLAAIFAECQEVARTPEGSRNQRLNVAAYNLGQLVGGGEIERTAAEDDLLEAALSAGLSEKEARRTIRSGLDSGERAPRTAPERSDGWVEGQPPEFNGLDDVPPPTDNDAPPDLVVDVNDDQEWTHNLILEMSKDGVFRVKPCGPNALVFVRHHPAIRNRIGLDERSMRPCWTRPPPWEDQQGSWRPFKDSDADELALWLSAQEGVVLNRDHYWRAMCAEAERHPFDVVRQWLETLVWDRVERLSMWLQRHCQAPFTEYVVSVGRAWLVSAVARTFQPGVQADHMLVLEGPQGAGKTSTIRELASGDNYAEITVTDAKDSVLSVHGPWIIEWSELSGISKRDAESVKAFISRRVDHVRLPYGRVTIDIPRRCVFAGSTNEGAWQTDPTGGRRYWPVRVGECDVRGLRDCREQLWAEAVEAYRQSERWWLTDDRLKEAMVCQDARYEGDPWEEKVRVSVGPGGRFMGRDRLSLGDIVTDALELPAAAQTTGTGRRIARIMERLGWSRIQYRNGDSRVRGYARPQGLGIDTGDTEDTDGRKVVSGTGRFTS